MKLSAGIVGLPNVGKSTLFNTITNSQVEAANYPFATIEPNVGVVKVNDDRLNKLAALINPNKVTPALCYFTDIAGLVKGASKGEGLGNQFLANIREVDAICHVVRCFNDSSITHIMENVDPIRDCEIINTELIIADLDSMDKRYSKISSKAKSGDKVAMFELEIAKKIMNLLKSSNFIDKNIFNGKEMEIVKQYNLLTIKPILYIANIDESDIGEPNNNQHFINLKKYIGDKHKIIPLAIAMEYEISKLDDNEKKVFMEDLKINKTGLDILINSTYDLLGIQTFFTFGMDETRA
jgi:GTP-binding protein YchF